MVWSVVNLCCKCVLVIIFSSFAKAQQISYRLHRVAGWRHVSLSALLF